ncbi:MAG: PfkB family carbohydrate kinase [Shimia sp.]
MTVHVFGSINIDIVYAVPHIAAPGETLAATAVTRGLGGKGANQAVAAARAGASVRLIGAVGPDGDWVLGQMRGYGVGVDHVARVEVATGQAIIQVADDGENAIVLFPGANRAQDVDRVRAALAGAASGDTLMLQAEVNGVANAAEAFAGRVIYSAAPFDLNEIRAVLPHIDLLALNAVEAEQVVGALGTGLGDLGPQVIVTRGADGAEWIAGAERLHVPAPKVEVVDTTGAGDTFVGYVAAGLDVGMEIGPAMERAAQAAALQVGREGAAEAIPAASELSS